MEGLSIPIDWLLASPDPWVVYKTRLDLLGEDPQNSNIRQAYQAFQAHPQVAGPFDALDV